MSERKSRAAETTHLGAWSRGRADGLGRRRLREHHRAGRAHAEPVGARAHAHARRRHAGAAHARRHRHARRASRRVRHGRAPRRHAGGRRATVVASLHVGGSPSFGLPRGQAAGARPLPLTLLFHGQFGFRGESSATHRCEPAAANFTARPCAWGRKRECRFATRCPSLGPMGRLGQPPCVGLPTRPQSRNGLAEQSDPESTVTTGKAATRWARTETTTRAKHWQPLCLGFTPPPPPPAWCQACSRAHVALSQAQSCVSSAGTKTACCSRLRAWAVPGRTPGCAGRGARCGRLHSR